MWVQDEFDRVYLDLNFSSNDDLNKVTNHLVSEKVWGDIEDRHQRRAHVYNVKRNSNGTGGLVKLRLSSEWLSYVIDILHALQLRGHSWQIVNPS
jgi:hypothetical protein